MSETCETVKIKSDDGFTIINKSDLTKDHVLFHAEKKAAKKKIKKD